MGYYLKMKRIYGKKSGFLKRILIRTFLNSSTNPEFFDMLGLAIEIIIFTFFVSSWLPLQSSSLGMAAGILPDFKIESENWIGYVIIGGYVAFIAIRIILLKNLFKPFYILAVITAQSMESPDILWMRVMIWVLVLLSVAVEILSNYELLFASQNFHSEYYNSQKILHYLFMIGSVVLRIYQQKITSGKIIAPIASISLFTFLLIMKYSSTSRNRTNKQLYVRFYILTITLELINLIGNWAPQLQKRYIQILGILIFQIIYIILVHKIPKPTVGQFITSKNKEKPCFQILCYYFGQQYNQQNEEILNEFLETESLQKKGKSEKRKNNLKFYGKPLGISRVGSIVYRYLEEHDTFDSLLLRAQVRFYLLDQIILAKQEMVQTKNKIYENNGFLSPITNLFKRLLLFKFERKIQMQIEKKYKANKKCAFDDFLKNEQIRNLLVKSTLATIEMWEAIISFANKCEVLYNAMKKIVEKVESRRNKFAEIFGETQIICKQVMWSAIQYIYMVENNVQHANALAKQYNLFPESHIFLQSHQKIYISLRMDTCNFMGVSCVSYNIKKLLAYNKHDVKGRNVSLFLPDFLVEYHQTVIEEKVTNHNSNQLYSFHKQTIIRHAEEYYLPMKAYLKIVYNPIDGEIFLEGHLKIQRKQYYDWTNYLFMNPVNNEIIKLGKPLQSQILRERDTIVQTSDLFITKNKNIENDEEDLERPRLFVVRGQVSMTQQFLNRRNDKLYYQMQEGQIEYHLIQQITKGNQKIKYYVAKQTKALHMDEGQGSTKNIQQSHQSEEELVQVNKYAKFSVTSQNISNLPLYFARTKTITEEINKKGFTIFFGVIIFMFLIVFGLQKYLAVDELTKDQQNEKFVTNFQAMKIHSNRLNQISIEVSLIQLIFNYNYTAKTSPFEYEDQTMTLQKTTQILAKYNQQLYEIKEQQGQLYGLEYQPKHAQNIMNQLSTSQFMIGYLSNPSVLEISMSNLQRQINFVYSDVLEDYVDRYNLEIQNLSDNDAIIRILLTNSIALAMLICAVIIYVKIKMIKKLEFQSICALLKINFASFFLNNSKQYIMRSVGGISEIFNESKEVAIKATTRDQEKINRDISSRENSVRDLITDSGPHDYQDREAMAEVGNESTIEPPKDLIPKLPVACIFSICGLFIIYLIGFSIYRQEDDEDKIVNSLIKLSGIMERQLYFSATMIGFLNGLNSGSFKLFEHNIAKYEEIEGSINFHFLQSEQNFPQFTKRLHQMRSESLCDYMDCPEIFKPDLNIPYGAAIHKMNTYMSDHMNTQQITNKADKIDLLIYSQQLTTNVTTKLLDTYIAEFQKYISFTSQTCILSIELNYIMLVIYGIVVLGFFEGYWIPREKTRILKITNLIAENSFEQKTLESYCVGTPKFSSTVASKG